MAGKRRPRQNGNRARRLDRRRTAPGTAPGTLVIDPLAKPTEIRAMAYDGTKLHEQSVANAAEIADLRKKYRCLWIDVTGLGSESRLQELAQVLDLHHLAMEDVINVHQRAKVDEFQDSLFVVARMTDESPEHVTEQLSFFLIDGVLITFQERPGDCWEPIRNRLRNKRGRIFEAGVDYLLYALLDAAIDSYFPAMERISEHAEQIDEALSERFSSEQLRNIHQLRQELLGLRRSLRPHREMLNELLRAEVTQIREETKVHLRDTYDHVIQLTDSIDTYRELTSDLRDYYLSSINNNMNEVMKVLTIISTIFIPLSFIAGVYGMNFSQDSPWNMPELKWYWGYPFALVLMATVAFGLILFFRTRRWM